MSSGSLTMKFFRRLSKPLRSYRNNLRHKLLSYKTSSLVSQLTNALSEDSNNIPVIIISYNNGIYVDNMVKQLQRYAIKPIIIDNNSSSSKTHAILNDIMHADSAHIVRSNHNYGHMVGFLKPVYDALPEVFAYTDPDLELNHNLPDDFLMRLSELTKSIAVFKAGFALALEGHGALKDIKFHSCHYKPIHYEADLSIHEFEARYWINRLHHDTLEIYSAPIDTTFAVYRKENYIGDFYSAIRVAGDYSAIHLPWFDHLDLLKNDDRSEYREGNISTNWSR